MFRQVSAVSCGINPIFKGKSRTMRNVSCWINNFNPHTLGNISLGGKYQCWVCPPRGDSTSLVSCNLTMIPLINKWDKTPPSLWNLCYFFYNFPQTVLHICRNQTHLSPFSSTSAHPLCSTEIFTLKLKITQPNKSSETPQRKGFVYWFKAPCKLYGGIISKSLKILNPNEGRPYFMGKLRHQKLPLQEQICKYFWWFH